jgi:hypothetical protein
MVTITESQYYSKHRDYRGVWSTDRSDIPGWKAEDFMGKRTMLHYDNGTCLIIEGQTLTIVPDEDLNALSNEQLLNLYNGLHKDKRPVPAKLAQLVASKKLIKTYKGTYHS